MFCSQGNAWLWLHNQQRHWAGGEMVLHGQVAASLPVDTAAEAASLGDAEE